MSADRKRDLQITAAIVAVFLLVAGGLYVRAHPEGVRQWLMGVRVDGGVVAGFGTIAIFIGLLSLYFAPTIVASRRGNANESAVAVVNLLLGWTLLGWVIAWVMALSGTTVAEKREKVRTQADMLGELKALRAEVSAQKGGAP